jgi:hypothetical protein
VVQQWKLYFPKGINGKYGINKEVDNCGKMERSI